MSLNLVDAHLHLSDPDLGVSIREFLAEAKTVGLRALVTAASSYEDAQGVLQLAREHKLVRAAVGIHPWTVVEGSSNEANMIRDLVHNNREVVTAIGEIGLDGKYSQNSKVMSMQERVFGKMLLIATENSLPVVVHSRLAVQQVLDQLGKFDLRGVLLHWYSGPTELLKTIHDRGYFISVGPSVAYSKRIIQIVEAAPIEMILTETDAPVKYYGQFKGRRTSPQFIQEVIARIGQIKGLPTNTAVQQVEDNFGSLFGGSTP